MTNKKTWQKTIICAGAGCIATFERRSPRHKYCDECSAKRKEGYYKDWYENRGGRETKRVYYETVLKGDSNVHQEEK